MLHGSAGMPDNGPKKSSEQQLNRACESCRMSKVRCLVNSASPSQCQRCAKSGKQCIFTPPAKRRQRKRTDVRVAELEKTVHQMRHLLETPTVHGEPDPMDEGSDEKEAPDDSTESPAYTHSHESTTTRATGTRPDMWPEAQNAQTQGTFGSRDTCERESLGTSDIDIIDRGLVTLEMAEELLNIYRKELVYECPGVIIPTEWSASQLRFKKPALFHAVMAAASHSKGQALSNRLHEEVVYLYARSLFIRAEKSIQYVQALIVTITYYTPPNMPAQLQVYQYINMAASMALELGLASKPRTHEQLPKRAIRSLQRISSAQELLENCRTILVLYTLSAGFAMRLRRPSILSFNSWMEECLALLQKSSILEDKRLVALIQLQRIADEANTAFGFDDASTSFSLSELRLQVIMRMFERKMQDWKKSITNEIMSTTAMMEYHSNMMAMWEFGMDGGRYDAPEFRNRQFTLPALDDDCVQPESLLSRSALQVNSTIKCINAAHSLLDCFLSYTNANLQKAPNVIFVRTLFALVSLLKAEYAVGTDSEISEVLDSQSLKVDFYLDAVVQATSKAIGPQKCRVPSHWLFVLEHKLKTWHDEYKQWRKEGRHLHRKQPQQHPEEPFVSTTMPEMKTSSAQPMLTPSSDTLEQTTRIPASFSLDSGYPSWPTRSVPMPAQDTTSGLGPQSTFTNSMGDFSAAFQNGDLYLWNDINDNFGGWIPQGGGLYSEMQFGE